MTVRIINQDCREAMAAMDACSVDAIVTDPPYGLGFMGKGWDHGVPGVEFWQAAMAVAKPGAYLLAFGGTRTFHRLAVAIEDAGWEIRDTVMWVYGSGFPKSLDVSKAIDKAAGAEREVLGRNPNSRENCDITNSLYEPGTVGKTANFTAPATDAAKKWQGWGTALKPAWEPIIMARKPLAGTVAANVEKHGTGALNIDACRISTDEKMSFSKAAPFHSAEMEQGRTWNPTSTPGIEREQSALGRWPANLIHDGSDEVLAAFPEAPGQQRTVGPEHGEKASVNVFGDYGPRDTFNPRGDGGSAARFFYCAKADKTDRNDGLRGMPAKEVSYMNTHGGNAEKGETWSPIDERTGKERDRFSSKSQNHHPTVKPTDLMRYLCRLVTPKGGTVLDPFMGSGSTLKAAELEGFSAIGIEIDPEYCEIARKRIASDAPLFAEVA